MVSSLSVAVWLVVSTVVLNVASSTRPDLTENGWRAFKEKFGKTYSDSTNDGFRRAIREMKADAISRHNQEADAGKASFHMSENKFSDMTPAEYRKLLGYKAPSTASTGGHGGRRRRQISIPWMPTNYQTVDVTSLPASVDWTAAGWVGPVLDQGYYCGSCWAYSSAGALTAQFFNKTSTLVQMSPQNLIDCSTDNFGCSGGAPEAAYYYVQSNGIESLIDYPETSVDTGEAGTCQYSSASSKSSLISWRGVDATENALQQAVAQVGPVTTAIDASLDSFQMYSDGVYSDAACGSNLDSLNHAILIVGYGTTSTGQDYWLCKNSWGTYWGMDGYFMLARNSNNMCGIALTGSFPVLY